MMSKLKSILAYGVAGLGIPIILVTFMGMPFWMNLLVANTGLKVSPWYTGAEVVRSVDHGQYRTLIHRPVFDALIGERSNGFVQVDWKPINSVPEEIAEEIDLDGNGSADFQVVLNSRSGRALLIPYSSQVTGLEGTYKLKDSWAIRVQLKNPRKGK
jgi:hypothetical protein